MELKDTLVRPIITEKSTTFLGNDRTYAFEVSLSANKRQVKRAIESFYGVDVETVRTLVVRGKTKRFGRHYGKRKNWKKAYVTLAEGHSINLYDSSVS
jgi:large subunit ribosomal protein L23